MTGYFVWFIFLAVSNAFNTRTNKINLFSHLSENPDFLKVMGLIVFVQVLFAEFGGVIMRCFGLTISEWGFVTLFALTIIPVDIIRKLIIGSK